MSLTLSLTGRGSYLNSYYHPPIELNPNYDYGLGLVGIYTFNALQNIYDGNDKIYWSRPDNPNPEVLKIPSGAYEIRALDEYIEAEIRKKDGRNRGGKEQQGDERVFSLTANTNTLQCIIKSKYTIDFRPSDSISRMLGYSKRVLEANIVHESDLDVRIAPATNIRIQCNITGGAYLNGIPDHTIFEFALDAEPGELVAKEPSSVLYLPVNTRRIEDISLWLTDQGGNVIFFGNEEVSIRLELKKWG